MYCICFLLLWLLKGNKFQGFHSSYFSKLSLNYFTCFDGSKKIPINQVNDGFCDCDDGSDESGTSSCANSFYFCLNRGAKPQRVLSRNVNDGVCDCCDGSDEADSDFKTFCPNTCRTPKSSPILFFDEIYLNYKTNSDVFEKELNKSLELFLFLKRELKRIKPKFQILSQKYWAIQSKHSQWLNDSNKFFFENMDFYNRIKQLDLDLDNYMNFTLESVQGNVDRRVASVSEVCQYFVFEGGGEKKKGGGEEGKNRNVDNVSSDSSEGRDDTGKSTENEGEDRKKLKEMNKKKKEAIEQMTENYAEFHTQFIYLLNAGVNSSSNLTTTTHASFLTPFLNTATINTTPPTGHTASSSPSASASAAVAAAAATALAHSTQRLRETHNLVRFCDYYRKRVFRAQQLSELESTDEALFLATASERGLYPHPPHTQQEARRETEETSSPYFAMENKLRRTYNKGRRRVARYAQEISLFEATLQREKKNSNLSLSLSLQNNSDFDRLSSSSSTSSTSFSSSSSSSFPTTTSSSSSSSTTPTTPKTTSVPLSSLSGPALLSLLDSEEASMQMYSVLKYQRGKEKGKEHGKGKKKQEEQHGEGKGDKNRSSARPSGAGAGTNTASIGFGDDTSSSLLKVKDSRKERLLLCLLFSSNAGPLHYHNSSYQLPLLSPAGAGNGNGNGNGNGSSGGHSSGGGGGGEGGGDGVNGGLVGGSSIRNNSGNSGSDNSHSGAGNNKTNNTHNNINNKNNNSNINNDNDNNNSRNGDQDGRYNEEYVYSLVNYNALVRRKRGSVEEREAEALLRREKQRKKKEREKEKEREKKKGKRNGKDGEKRRNDGGWEVRREEEENDEDARDEAAEKDGDAAEAYPYPYFDTMDLFEYADSGENIYFPENKYFAHTSDQFFAESGVVLGYGGSWSPNAFGLPNSHPGITNKTNVLTLNGSAECYAKVRANIEKKAAWSRSTRTGTDIRIDTEQKEQHSQKERGFFTPSAFPSPLSSSPLSPSSSSSSPSSSLSSSSSSDLDVSDFSVLSSPFYGLHSTLEFVCGRESRLVYLKETGYCHYEGVVESPCFCTQENIDELREEKKQLETEEKQWESWGWKDIGKK